MGEIHIPRPTCLVCGILLTNASFRDDLFSVLEKEFGPIDEISEEKDFSFFSHYYEKEMGKGLIRFFVSFQNHFDPERFADIKTLTNQMEQDLSVTSNDNKRKVNIDPGYLDLSHIVVASTKDASYRVYLQSGIYSQPMLMYVHGSFRPFEWTYPDYKHEAFISFFNKVRDKYKDGK